MDIKICGVCRPEDARAAAQAGATYVGVILEAPGPRRRTGQQARAIFDAAGDVLRVGVFADAAVAIVIGLAGRLGLDVVQLHGSESTDSVARIAAAGPWRVWKATWPRDARELAAAATEWQARVDGILVDAASGGVRGGTGVQAPWRALAAGRWSGAPAFVLAGGLRPDNVRDAVGTLSPDIVDVSSGVEAAAGRKDRGLMHAFVRAAREAAAATQESVG